LIVVDAADESSLSTVVLVIVAAAASADEFMESKEDRTGVYREDEADDNVVVVSDERSVETLQHEALSAKDAEGSTRRSC
jgi:hypothetical protein